jgi:hypothetical protein
VNYRQSFLNGGQYIAEAMVEVMGVGFVDQLAQQAASANAKGAYD